PAPARHDVSRGRARAPSSLFASLSSSIHNLLVTGGCIPDRKLPQWPGSAVMRGVVVCWTGAFAAALAWCGIASASDEPESNAEAVAHLLFFSGTDVWRNGGFLHGGFLYAYQGLSQDGPVFKLL